MFYFHHNHFNTQINILKQELLYILKRSKETILKDKDPFKIRTYILNFFQHNPTFYFMSHLLMIFICQHTNLNIFYLPTYKLEYFLSADVQIWIFLFRRRTKLNICLTREIGAIQQLYPPDNFCYCYC